MANEVGPVNISAQWALDPTIQATLSNQLFIQWDGTAAPEANTPDGAYLTFGHVNPPVFSLPPGEQPSPEMVSSFVAPVVPVARVYCSFERLKAFANELNKRIAEAEEAARA